MKKGLDQYRGSLSPAQIAAGMNAARENASRLLNDAKLLAQSERYASATALAILSVEEVGKDGFLRELSYANDPKAIKNAWRRYRSHTSKNAIWVAPDLAMKGIEYMGPAMRRPLSVVRMKNAFQMVSCRLGPRFHRSRQSDHEIVRLRGFAKP